MKRRNEKTSGRPIVQFVIVVLGVAIAACFSGCATGLAHHDQNGLRDVALQYYEDQIMDNLIRAKNGLLFMHINIGAVNGTIKTQLSGTINGGQSLANSGGTSVTSKLGTIPQIVGSIGTVATRPFTFSLSPERDDTITINSAPQVADAFVYDMYLRYLNLKAPGPLTINPKIKDGTDAIPDISDSESVVSIRQRKPGEKLIEGGSSNDDERHYVPGTLRHWHGSDYYIPIAYKQSYFDLCIALVGRVVTAETGKGGGGGGKTSKGSGTSTRMYVPPPFSESPGSKLLQDIRNQIQLIPPFDR